jgi:hypothetical protein
MILIGILQQNTRLPLIHYPRYFPAHLYVLIRLDRISKNPIEGTAQPIPFTHNPQFTSLLFSAAATPKS